MPLRVPKVSMRRAAIAVMAASGAADPWLIILGCERWQVSPLPIGPLDPTLIPAASGYIG